jgi:hypothetical protein
MIYLFIGAIFILFSFMEIIKYEKWFSTLFLTVFCIVLVLFAGLRDGSVVGTDSPAYFLNYKYNFWETEYGYKYLNLFFSNYLQCNYNIFLLFLNSISLFLIGKYIKINSVYYILPLLIFYSDLYLYFNISGIRQAMALSFVCVSVYFAFNKNLKLFLLFIFFASQFHVSSLVFLFAYFIPHVRLKLKHILLIIIGLVAIGYAGDFISTKFEYLNKKADYYSKYQEKSENIQVAYTIGILKRGIILIIALIYRKYFFIDKKFVYFFNLYLVGFLIFISTYLISPDFGVRFSVYYTISESILVGLMLFMVKDIRQRLIIVTVFSLVCIYKLTGYSENEYYIYNSILDYIL